jgi:hypothetical protein
LAISCLLAPLLVFAAENAALTERVDWEKMEASFEVTLPLKESGFSLPQDRSASEAELARQFILLAKRCIEALPVDSSTSIGSLIESGRLDESFAETRAAALKGTPPFLTTDFSAIRTVYRLSLDSLRAIVPARQSPASYAAALTAESPSSYTGVVIIADGDLPIHGKRSVAKPAPALAPKLWDEDMNLLYDPNDAAEDGHRPSFRYMATANIFSARPGGLSTEAEAIVGTNPLRVLASAVFGIRPTDLILQNSDALKLKSPETRSLLDAGKLVIILDDGVLKGE